MRMTSSAPARHKSDCACMMMSLSDASSAAGTRATTNNREAARPDSASGSGCWRRTSSCAPAAWATPATTTVARGPPSLPPPSTASGQPPPATTTRQRPSSAVSRSSWTARSCHVCPLSSQPTSSSSSSSTTRWVMPLGAFTSPLLRLCATSFRKRCVPLAVTPDGCAARSCSSSPNGSAACGNFQPSRSVPSAPATESGGKLLMPV
mmetsp:Transcript_67735/g.189682  ORF Transcript_67735/g.189682 Transcript_67735/m.189682 type:complete len:207 (+) Transcript_67735:888-1508(+)